MRPPVYIYATMADGTVLMEHAADFRQFVAIVLPFRRDPECVVLTWQPVSCQPGSPAYLAASAAWRERIECKYGPADPGLAAFIDR